MVVVLATVVVAAVAAVRARRRGGDPVVAAARAGALGSLALIVLTTALPFGWPIRDGWGDLLLMPGRGGLRDLRDLVQQPGSLDSLLLVGNLLLYAPFAGLMVVGWAMPVVRAVALAAGASVTIELWQLVAVSRVAAIDDVVLNVAGAAAGGLIGLAVDRRRAARRTAARR